MAAETETAAPQASELQANASQASEPEASAPQESERQASAPKAKQAKAKEPKQKGKQANQEGAADASGLSIAAHPRAARNVAQAKGWGGLVGFLVGGYLSLPTNTLAGAALHALVAGVASYVMVWAGAVFLWRHLVVAELRSRQHQLLEVKLARSYRDKH